MVKIKIVLCCLELFLFFVNNVKIFLNNIELLNTMNDILFLILNLWWLWLPIILYYAFYNLWLIYIREKHWQSIDWIILELRPPREISGSPKPFEYFFTSLFSLVGNIDTYSDIFFEGRLQAFFSAEIVGIAGKIHFLIRIPRRQKNLVETQIYAQYPDIEVLEVEDYAKSVPLDAPNAEWDLFGTKMILAKPDAYPIRTYAQFLEIGGGSAEDIKRFIDPLSSLMEVLSNLKEGEQLWFQILCRPTTNDWKEEGIAIINKIMGRPAAKPKRGFIESEIISWFDLIKSVISVLFTGQPALPKKEELAKMGQLSSGEQEIVKAIELNISKRGFESTINFLYAAKRGAMDKVNVGGFFGMMDQFGTLNLNSFKIDKKTLTSVRGLFASKIKLQRKRVLMKMCRERSFWSKGFVLNIEELATIFHFPVSSVMAPKTPRMEIKKGVPPIGLPIG